MSTPSLTAHYVCINYRRAPFSRATNLQMLQTREFMEIIFTNDIGGVPPLFTVHMNLCELHTLAVCKDTYNGLINFLRKESAVAVFKGLSSLTAKSIKCCPLTGLDKHL